MDYPAALEKLLCHAALSKQQPVDDEFYNTLFLIQHKKTFCPVKPLADDVLACYETINNHLNGTNPEETAWTSKARVIDRDLAYAVSIITEEWRTFHKWVAAESGFSPDALDEIAWSVRAIELGWNFVLDGDFNSITDEVVLYNAYGL